MLITNAADLRSQLNAALERVVKQVVQVARTAMADACTAQDLEIATTHATLRAQREAVRQRVEVLLHDDRAAAHATRATLEAHLRDARAAQDALTKALAGAQHEPATALDDGRTSLRVVRAEMESGRS